MSIVPTPGGEIAEPEKQRGLGFWAICSGVAFLISIGLCGISPKLTHDEWGGTLGLFSAVGMLCSFLALLGVAVAAILDKLRDYFWRKH